VGIIHYGKNGAHILPTPGGNNLRNLSKPTNQTVKTTAGITDYLNLPSSIDTYVDPVTQRLQNMYGDVTKKTPAYAYAGGKNVTALTEIERKMCEIGKKIETNIQNKMADLPEPAKQALTFLGGFSDRVLSNLLPGEINNKPYQETYQVSYSNGQLLGDITSLAIGAITTLLGGIIATAGGLGELLGGDAVLTGAGAPAGVATIGISIEVIAAGAGVTAYGVSVSMSASSNLGEDISESMDTDKNVTEYKFPKSNKDMKNTFGIDEKTFHKKVKPEILKQIKKDPKYGKKFKNCRHQILILE
jgi:hypothetical protein